MATIDFHSHILPGIDDGARNLETSLAMLEQIRQQQIDIMIATPHFYAMKDRVESFLEKREQAWRQLEHAMQSQDWSGAPEILTGSEVAFFEGISGAKEIRKLTIQDTDLLLLEMPFVKWSESTVREVDRLIKEQHLRILIAHLERFLWIPGNKIFVQQLLNLPVSVQINAEFAEDWHHRRTLLKMLEEGTAHVLGSDCHGAHHRVPNLKAGRDYIEKKKGARLLEEIDRRGEALLFGS